CANPWLQRAEPCRARDQSGTKRSPGPECGFIAGEAAERGGDQDTRKTQIAQLRGDSGEQKHGLAFDETSDGDGGIPIFNERLLPVHPAACAIPRACWVTSMTR